MSAEIRNSNKIEVWKCEICGEIFEKRSDAYKHSIVSPEFKKGLFVAEFDGENADVYKLLKMPRCQGEEVEMKDIDTGELVCFSPHQRYLVLAGEQVFNTFESKVEYQLETSKRMSRTLKKFKRYIILHKED